MQKCHCHETIVEMIKVQGLTTRISMKEIQMQYKNHSLGPGNYSQLCINLSHMVCHNYHKIENIERTCSQHVI